jgi:hypothetical protein
MGKQNQDRIQLVISHLEGCSGNFLGRLFADDFEKDQTLFRVDTNLHSGVAAIDGFHNWQDSIKKLEDHHVVVTHNFDLKTIKSTFPNAKIIQIYPYTHVGNVLYNVCFKKLNVKIPNVIDNHLLHIREWYKHIQARYPKTSCTNFWDLTDQSKVEQLLDIKFTNSQINFFDQYWQQQLMYPLTIPNQPRTIEQLITEFNITDHFDKWLGAWTIFVYELINSLREEDRAWSIDACPFDSWSDVEQIQDKYLTLTTK